MIPCDNCNNFSVSTPDINYPEPMLYCLEYFQVFRHGYEAEAFAIAKGCDKKEDELKNMNYESS